ncbi:MAG: FctA domain-containing protein [Olegusella sp.]|nr:FctA domain-containing protein [Olegusella sp.]
MSIPIPAAPTNLDNEYNYTISGGYVVITNCKTISAASRFQGSITYTIQRAAGIPDMQMSRDLAVSMTIRDEGQEPVADQSNILHAQLNTRVNLREVDKQAVSFHDEWQSVWGAKPDDADDYVYMIWGFGASITPANQPYSVHFSDTPGEGELVAYTAASSVGSISYRSITQNMRGLTEPTYTMDAFHAWQSGGGSVPQALALVRYPKSEILDGEEHVLTNTAQVTVTSDDGIDSDQTDTMQATYTFKPVQFSLPPGLSTFSKTEGWPNVNTGGLEFLEAGLSTQMGPYSTIVVATGYASTLSDGADPTKAESYGDPNKPYLIEVTDEYFYLTDEENASVELGDGDYEIPDLTLEADYYAYKANLTKGVYELVSDWTGSFSPIDVYGKFSTGWVKLGTLTSYSPFTFESEYEGAEQTSDWHRINLPSGCLGVRASMSTTAARASIRITVRPTLFPTDRVKAWAESAPTSSAGVRSRYLGDVSSGRAISSSGDYLLSTGWDSTPNTYRARISEQDMAQYGRVVAHDYVAKQLTGFQKESSMEKTATFSNNSARKRIEITYRLTAYERTYYSGSDPEPNYLIANGIIDPQEDGTFYDLLPKGVEPDPDTVTASIYVARNRTLSPYDDEGSEGPIVSGVDVKPNWNGTGRTMLIVHVENPEHLACSYKDTYSGVYSGFGINFRAYYSWEAMQDYGKNLVNLAAYMSGNDSIIHGWPDDHTIGGMRWTDLNEDGVYGDGAPTNVLYASNTLEVNAATTAEASLSKRVRGGDTLGWVDGVLDGDVRLNAGDDYEYRLRYATGRGSTGKDIIFYDSLETYSPEGDAPDAGSASWKGEFQGIDVSQMIDRGVDAKIYYSTVENLDIPSHQDLSEAAVWSLEAPTDLADVTAIAIDCTTASDGTPFLLLEEQSLVAIVSMKVPDDESWVGAQCAKDAYAFNQIYSAGIISNDLGEVTSDQLIHNEYTKVGLITPLANVPVEKVWDVPEGTAVPDSVTVRLLADGEAVTVDGEEVTAELTADGDWAYTFEGLVKYDEDGERIAYTVEEDVPDGYQYDTAGDMDEGFTVTNEPMEPVEAPIAITKILEGRGFQDGDAFTFQIDPADGAPMPDGADEDGQVTIEPAEGGEAEVDFGTATFDVAGTYVYTIAEVAGDDPDIEYGADEVAATVEVTRGSDGKLSATVAYSPDGAVITNTYYEPVEVVPAATKILEGRGLAAGEFSFELLDAEGSVIQTATNAADGSVTFEPLAFGLADLATAPAAEADAPAEDDGADEPVDGSAADARTFSYTIREVKGSLENVTYDTQEITLTITLSKQDGKLVAEAAYTPDAATFTNTYAPPEGQADGGSGGKMPATGDGAPLAPLAAVACTSLAILALVARRMGRERG